MTMRGSIQHRFVLLALASLFCLAQARPPSKQDAKQSDAQNLQKIKEDLQWESQWWTPQQKKETKDTKDNWKAFKTEKPAVRRRWWEEDWNEDEWWAPKHSDNSNTVSKKKSVQSSKSGEDQSKLNNNDDANLPADKPPKQVQDPAPAPQALPLVSASSALQDTQSGFSLKDDGLPGKTVNKKMDAPVAESPREKLDPVLKGDTLISPFEDPKPGPYSGPRDEAPSHEEWQYHQLTGFGKYTEGEDKEADKVGLEAEDEKAHKEAEDKEFLQKVDEEIQKEEDNRAVNLPEETKQHAVDQFYGFGLESEPAQPVAAPSADKQQESDAPANAEQSSQPMTPADAQQQTPEKQSHNKENYNRGVIYDVIPGAPERTHSVKKDLTQSVKKDLTHSVKKDLSQDYMEDFVSTKANPQTSPNPPPPGLTKKEDSETTPVAPSKMSPKNDMSSFFIKSHPLTYCKVDQECRKGRMCRSGVCVCLPSDGCAGHHKPVCGSDGVQYPSFCELHRTACVTHIHIKVDHTGSCFTSYEKTKEMMKIQKEIYKDHLLPTASSESEDDDGDEDSDEVGANDSDYEEEYDYGDEEEEKSEKTGDDDDEDEVDAWLKDKSEKLNMDSKKMYNCSKDLKNAALKKSQQDDNKVDTSPWDHVQEEMGDDFKAKGGKLQGEGYPSMGGYKECTKGELAKFKHQLLTYHCQRFEEPHCQLEVKEERDYLTNLMFSYFDMNTDYQLSCDELKSRQESEQFGQLSDACELMDLIWFDDLLNADGRLSLDEFEQAFYNLEFTDKQGSSDSTDKASPSSLVVHVIPTLATVGNGLELKCGLAATGSDVVWRRHGINIRDLAMVELLVLDDGSLFFSKMGVHHMGNYSCEDSNDPSVLQVHSLKVQMPPIVKVSPHSRIEPSGLNVKMKCHAEGVPKPTISWQMNNTPLDDKPNHYSVEDNKELLIIYEADYEKDTGAYKCVAKNQAGTSEDVTSVFVIGDKDKPVGVEVPSTNPGTFAEFHKDGYTAYNPTNCLKVRSVHGDFGYFKFIPDSLDGPLRLCDDGQDCSWGSVVNVKNSFVYASQPNMNRVVVIETSKNWIPVQVISTDKHPVQLHYVEHLDQVWVLCWNGEEDESTKTMVVIRDASKYVQHRAVHTQPVGNHFDQIQALFIAPSNDLRHAFDYGYVTHNGQQGLTKLDLDNMRYVKAVDLSAYDCVPRSLTFVPIGGHVVVECVSPLNHQTLQLVMDYITDAVVSTTVLSGRPYVSPDSRHVVTVDDLTGKVSVAGVSNEGTLEAAYEVTVSASISDVAFYPSSGHGYLLVLTSADDDNVITINLSTGKVDKMKGTDGTDTTSDWHPSPVKRTITSGDVFTDFLLAPSRSSITIMDMKFHRVRCEYTDSPRSQAAIFVGH